MSIPAYTPTDHRWMAYALHIASHGRGQVKTNPLVGAVVAHGDTLISEGYHARYGDLHAERNALLAVPKEYEHLLPEATLYVTLEPCNHHGQTPPCTDIILEKGIKRIVVCQLDPNPLMSGRSVDMLRQQGLEVQIGLLEEQGRQLNKAFYIQQREQRPYVILKYARSADGYIGSPDGQVWLSGAQTKLLTHRWRSEIDAILVGSQTIITDDPRLTTRAYPGHSPLRVVLDRRGRLTSAYQIAHDASPALIYTESHDDMRLPDTKEVHHMPKVSVSAVLHDLYRRGIGTVMIEGGAAILSSFIKEKLWDEARIITTPKVLNQGIKAPSLSGIKMKEYSVGADHVDMIHRRL